jgi:hypothetical protein
MSTDFKSLMERSFDPTDSDAAMQLAYKSLAILRDVVCAVRDYELEPRMHMGRDRATNLSVHVVEIGQALGLLSYRPSGAEVDKFRSELIGGM